MNESKFNNKGKVYANARPSYTDELLNYLVKNKIITTSDVVADIGSGTGIFTKQIALATKTVYAVEPNADMRAQAERHFLEHPNIISVNGTAEDTTLPDHSIDCITVAQAFHWFDRQIFKRECRRILRSTGNVILVWNDRDISQPIIRENFRINEQFCSHFNGSSNGISFNPENFDDFFIKRCQLVTFPNHLLYNNEMFINRNLSSSYAPKPGDKHYNAYVHALNDLFERVSENGAIEYPYITRCYIGTV